MVRELAVMALAVGLLIGALVVFEAKTVLAATSTSSTLLSVDAANLAPEDKLAKAKEDLTKALDLSLKKVDSLKGRLNELNFPELSREAELKNEALRDLDTYADYYNKAKENLEKTDSLEGVKELAKDVKEYRDATYTPGVEKIVRFILVFYNEEVLGVANDRLGKIEADVKKLDKLGVIKESDFRGKLDEAGNLLGEAAKLQGEAKKIILSATSTDAVKEKKMSARDMIEKSLNNVKTVYDIFLELNQSVKKALGL
ncbi:MAG: hypothetical protein HYW38_01725 [Candidatus Colwellbacteria bacterium]|nr:hypothetical protein [Candidatus Colwellbacteria bacterium]